MDAFTGIVFTDVMDDGAHEFQLVVLDSNLIQTHKVTIQTHTHPLQGQDIC